MTNPKSKPAAKDRNKSGTRNSATLPEQDLKLIPLSKLVLSPKNVRKTPASDVEDAELYASIKETGLKQNLLVHKVGAKFHVHAGGRRLAALNKLAGDKIIKLGHLISCAVEDAGQAEDTSAAENMVRAAMHAADQFAAFATLRAKGRTEDRIAAQFGITTDLVRRRLKLAAVAPELMEIFRADEMSLDCVMAFTLTDDHARQIEVWESVKQHYSVSPHSIRSHLTQKSHSGSSKLARFVTIEVYRQAGGTVIEDLFAERDTMHLEDPELLERLAQEKLEGLAVEAAKTWKWAEAHLETDYDSFRTYGRVYPQPLDPDPKLEAELEELQKRKDAMECDYDEATWTEELQEEEETVWDRLREIEDIQKANVAYTAEDHKIAGCVVTVRHNGEVYLETGLVRPEDIPASQETKTEVEGDEDAGDAGDMAPSGPQIELPQSTQRSTMSTDATEAARKAQGIPRSLVDDLRATRHQILQAHLAADYDTAYDAMLYAMVMSVLASYRNVSPLDVVLRPAMTTESREVLKETVAQRMLDALNEGLDLSWMEVKAPADFVQMCKLPQATKQALFAWCAAHALNQQLGNDSDARGVIEAIGVRLEVDVAACWRPTADTYWGRVNKNHALDMAKSLIDDRWADDKSGLRKAEIAKAMEQAFSDNPQAAAGLTATSAAKTARWLPDGMDFGDFAEDVSAKIATVDDHDDVEAPLEGDYAEALPAFMEDAA